MSDSKVTLRHATLCDDIRQENNGKFFLIGTYSGSVIPHTFPARLLLSYWIPIVPHSTEVQIELEVWITPDNTGKSERVGCNTAELQVDKADIGQEGAVPMTRASVAVESPSLLELKARSPGGRWKVLSSKRIEQSRS